jgi:hypothetical protein
MRAGIFLRFSSSLTLFAIMPSEQSYADRIGRFVLLKEACESMSPAFAPADTDITLAAQNTLVTTLNTCCTAVNTAQVELKDLTDPRVTLVKTMKERVTRAVSRVASNRAWASKLPAVKAAGDKVRGFKAPKPKLPPPPTDPDAPAPKKRDRGGQSYRDIEGYMGKFVSAVLKCAGYDTGAPGDIQSIMLSSLQSQLNTANTQIPEKEVVLGDAQIERLRIFESKKPLPDGSASLRDRWVRIKKAVKAQYGTASAEYALVRGIKY